MKKYLCIGDVVRSQTDGQWHYIEARRLPALYRVNPELCRFIDRPHHSRLFNDVLIRLRPDQTGAYKLPGVDSEDQKG